MLGRLKANTYDANINWSNTRDEFRNVQLLGNTSMNPSFFDKTFC